MSSPRVTTLDILAHAVRAHELQSAALRTVAEATGVGGPDDGEPPYAQHARRPGFRCVGAWDADQLIGYAYGMTTQPGSWWDTWVREAVTDAGCASVLDDAFELCAVFVDPQHHRRGVGRDLVTTVLADLDHRRAVLTTQSGPNPARAFYRRLGFLELPVEVSHGGVQYVVATAGLPLGAGRR